MENNANDHGRSLGSAGYSVDISTATNQETVIYHGLFTGVTRIAGLDTTWKSRLNPGSELTFRSYF